MVKHVWQRGNYALVGLAMIGLLAAEAAQAQINIGGFNQSSQNNKDKNKSGGKPQEDQNKSGGLAFPHPIPNEDGQEIQSTQKKLVAPTLIPSESVGQPSATIRLPNKPSKQTISSDQSTSTWQGSRKIGTFSKQYQTDSQPFSSAWYKQHPKVWQADVSNTSTWNTATTAGLGAWLGWNVAQQGQGQTIIVPGGVRGNQRQMDFRGYGRWYPLGVYTLLAGRGDEGTRMVQLAVDRQGKLRGAYYDMITNTTRNVSGSVRPGSPPRITWSLDSNKYLTFSSSLWQMLEPYGTMTVRLPGGEQKWQFVRMEY